MVYCYVIKVSMRWRKSVPSFLQQVARLVGKYKPVMKGVQGQDGWRGKPGEGQ
jgi:hypothetical protein